MSIVTAPLREVRFVMVLLSGLRVKTAFDPSSCFIVRTFGPSTESISSPRAEATMAIVKANAEIFKVVTTFIDCRLHIRCLHGKPPIDPMIWKTRRGLLDLTHRAKVMGILNVTPDSFSDGGEHFGVETAMIHARRMIAEGAALIDIGGESTRPGAAEVPADEELARVVPVISELRKEWDGLISIDTYKASVAAGAVAAGADIVNDVSGLTMDPKMAAVCVDSGCGVVVMHMKGVPRTMQAAPHYEDVVREVREYFMARLATLTAAGIDPLTLCFDPGIGFGKSLEHNLALLRAVGEISPSGRPILLGISRKSFIGKILKSGDIADREWPTIAITASSREKGIMLHRVHSVKPNAEALRMTEAIMGIPSGTS